jgi:hypothetical protein
MSGAWNDMQVIENIISGENSTVMNEEEKAETPEWGKEATSKVSSIAYD